MILSMTGFGKATFEFENKKATIEIKSLNSKQADISIRMPSMYKEKELLLRNLLSAKLERGKIECNVRIESNEIERAGRLNGVLIKNYYTQLAAISTDLGQEPQKEQLLQAILRFPDILKNEVQTLTPEEWKVLKTAVTSAVEDLHAFRKQEGDAMEIDLSDGINTISSLLEEVPPFEKERIEKVRNRINEQFSEFAKRNETDKNRFEQELIYHLDKLDINEEKVRLAHHCKYFLETMQEKQAVGKKLGFISQEIGREINTLGSKAQSAEIQRIVVQMKDRLEKIKEQLMNVL